MPGPEGPERPFISVNRAADEKGFGFHVQEIGHDHPTNGLRN
jgi:hypothetical protein